MASTPPTGPDPRTAADDDDNSSGEDSSGQGPSAAGASSPAPAEGGDDLPGEQPGSPTG